MGLGALVNWIKLKFRMKPKSINQLMLPITISGWLFGRGIIEFPLGKRWPVTSCIYSFVLVVGFCAVTKVTLGNIDLFTPTASKVGFSFFRAAMYVNSMIVICNTLIGWKNMKGVQIIINRLETSGSKMEKLGVPQDYKILYKRQLITAFFEIIFVIFNIEGSYSSIPTDFERTWYKKVASCITINYPFIVVTIGDAVLVTLARSLKLRFEELNKTLRQMSTTTDDSPQHKRILDRMFLKLRNLDDVFEKRTNDDSNLMRMASEHHYELVRIGILINETLGTQALLSMSFSFYVLIGLLYQAAALHLWSTLNRNIVDTETVILLSWVVFNGYHIMNMTSACANASDESKKTAIIICELHDPSTSKAFRDEISDFSLQLTQHTVKFTACGLFPLDNDLVHTMVASIATYLIILLQLGET